MAESSSLNSSTSWLTLLAAAGEGKPGSIGLAAGSGRLDPGKGDGSPGSGKEGGSPMSPPGRAGGSWARMISPAFAVIWAASKLVMETTGLEGAGRIPSATNWFRSALIQFSL